MRCAGSSTRGRKASPTAFRLRYAGEDPRQALREQFDEAVLRELRDRLARLDPEARWAWPCLDLIATQAGRPAAELASVLGLEKSRLKLGIRKLKALGLTESLEVGYRLSPRGRALIQPKT
jgi:hypothetical protein